MGGRGRGRGRNKKNAEEEEGEDGVDGTRRGGEGDKGRTKSGFRMNKCLAFLSLPPLSSPSFAAKASLSPHLGKHRQRKKASFSCFRQTIVSGRTSENVPLPI